MESQADFEIVGEAENGKQAIALVEELENTSQPPDLILMDVRMPVMDGVSATKKLVNRFSSLAVLVLSTFDDDEYITKALQFGAKGYLLKDTPLEDIANTIRTTSKGYTSFGPGLFQKFITQSTQSESNNFQELPPA